MTKKNNSESVKDNLEFLSNLTEKSEQTEQTETTEKAQNDLEKCENGSEEFQNSSFEKVKNSLEYIENLPKKKETKLDDKLDIKNLDFRSIQERTIIYKDYLTKYFDNYNKKTKHQTLMKWIFFGVTIFLMIVLVGITAFSIYHLSLQDNIGWSDASLAITSMAGVITAFIVLPNTIATNLFPSSDEDKSSEIFKSILDNDYNLRTLYNKQDINNDNNK